MADVAVAAPSASGPAPPLVPVPGTAPAAPPALQSALPRDLRWHDVALAGEDLELAVGVLTGALAAKGVRPGHVVGLDCDDTGRYVLALFALANLGTVVVPLAGARQRDAAALPPLDRIVLTNRPETGGRVVDLSTETRAVRSLARDAGLVRLRRPVDLRSWFESDRCLGLLTSGTTTGRPELVWRAGPELAENCLATARALGYTAEDAFLPLLPLSHQYGLSVIMTASVLGGGLVLCSRTRVREAARTMSRHSVTAVDAAPRLYWALLDEVRRERRLLEHLSGVRVWGVGGAPLPARLQREFTELVGRPLADGYGSTQLGNIAFVDRSGADGGMAPVDTYELRVVGEDGIVLPDGAVGRIHVRRRDARGPAEWQDTGDVGHLHAGRLSVHGRDGAINRNGHTLRLATLESRLRSGGVPVELVPVSLGSEEGYWAVIEDHLHRTVRHWHGAMDRLLDPFEKPDHVEVVGSLPTGSSDKPSRVHLESLVKGLQAGRYGDGRDLAPRLAALLEVAREERHALVDALVPISDPVTAAAEYAAFVRVLENAAGELALYRPDAPSPPVSVYLPSNNVLESYALFGLVPSMWAPRVRMRPARGTGRVVRAIHELFRHIPGGEVLVEEVSQAEFTAAVAARPGVVAFSGRRSNAEDVARRLGREHLVCFFGRGHNPVVLTAAADLDRAVPETVNARLYNGGQDCLAPDVVFAHASVVDDVVRRLSGTVEAHLRARPGGLARLHDPKVLTRTLHHLVTNGHRVRFGGQPDYGALQLTPAVLQWRLDEYGTPVEHFSPVLDIVAYDDEDVLADRLLSDGYLDAALGLTTYGLDETRARVLASRYVVAFERSLFGCVPSYEPFGGSGREAGFVQYRGRRHHSPILLSREVSMRWGRQAGETPAKRPEPPDTGSGDADHRV